jgi:hypothetical protein
MKFEKIFVLYGSLSFRVYDWQRPRLDTEWLLSTLFDASLLSTSKAAGNGGSFFARPAERRENRSYGVFNSAHAPETIFHLVAGLSAAAAQ